MSVSAVLYCALLPLQGTGLNEHLAEAFRACDKSSLNEWYEKRFYERQQQCPGRSRAPTRDQGPSTLPSLADDVQFTYAVGKALSDRALRNMWLAAVLRSKILFLVPGTSIRMICRALYVRAPSLGEHRARRKKKALEAAPASTAECPNQEFAHQA
jgi:hypothetical protein